MKQKNNTNPIILIGAGLEEMYKASATELKKEISISAGIDPSNISAFLNKKRNMRKNSLRKLTTGLDVYAVLLFIPSRNIKSDLLEYKHDEGIMYVKNCEDFLELIKSSANGTNSNNLEEQLIDQSLLNEIETLFEVIQSAKRNNVSKNTIKQKFCDAISDLAHSLSDSK